MVATGSFYDIEIYLEILTGRVAHMCCLNTGNPLLLKSIVQAGMLYVSFKVQAEVDKGGDSDEIRRNINLK